MSTPIAWYKGEDNMLDSVGTNHGSVPAGYDTMLYMDGMVGRAFNMGNDDDYFSAMITPYDANYIFTKNSTFTIDMYIKINSNYGGNWYDAPILQNANIFYPEAYFQFSFRPNGLFNIEGPGSQTISFAMNYPMYEWFIFRVKYTSGYWKLFTKINPNTNWIEIQLDPTCLSNYSPLTETAANVTGYAFNYTGSDVDFDEIKIYNYDVPNSDTPQDRRLTLKKDINPILTNQRVTSYRLDSFDNLQVKLVLNNRGRKSYLNNIPVDLYLNFTDEFVKYVSTTTDSNGTAILSLSCQNIEHDIRSCLGYAKVTVDSVEYLSNVLRFNFCAGAGSEHEVYVYPTEIMLYSTDLINL